MNIDMYKYKMKFGVAVHNPPPLVYHYDGIGESVSHRTTANVRFRFLRKIFTQISKLTSYIRKRCATFDHERKI
jgi:hypothetical protein